jgi:hypothetical protein
MSSILLTWELGSGLGHLARLRPLARRLLRTGREVALACRNPAVAEPLFPGVRVLPAPLPPSTGSAIEEPCTFAEVLIGDGCDDGAGLGELTTGWRDLYAETRADVVVMDYSPFALLASQGLPLRRVTLGTGFASPPDLSPLPDLRPWQDNYPDRLRMNEDLVLEAFNARLAAQGQPPLTRVAELYRRVDADLLATFAELDHYPQRSGGDYRGTWSDIDGLAPCWPEAEGPRVFLYLKHFPNLPVVLEWLAERRLPTLAYVGGADEAFRLRYGSDTLSIAGRPWNIQAAAGQADFAILHAGHGATAEMLLAGTPILQIPMFVEQYHVAQAVRRLEAGIVARIDDARDIREGLVEMPAGTHRRGAEAFAFRYRDYDSRRTVNDIADLLVELANRPLDR